MVLTKMPSFSRPWSAPTPIPIILIPRPSSPVPTNQYARDIYIEQSTALCINVFQKTNDYKSIMEIIYSPNNKPIHAEKKNSAHIEQYLEAQVPRSKGWWKYPSQNHHWKWNLIHNGDQDKMGFTLWNPFLPPLKNNGGLVCNWNSRLSPSSKEGYSPAPDKTKFSKMPKTYPSDQTKHSLSITK